MLDGLCTSFGRLRNATVMLGLALMSCAFGTHAAVALPAPTAGGVASAGAVSCPLKPSSATPTGEAWAFTATGLPSGPHAGISSSYVHGRGTWSGGRGGGTICDQDRGGAHLSHDLVLAVAGPSHVSPGITRLGRLGVGLALEVTVSASDDPACAAGNRGTTTLFASYYQGHHDSVQLRFNGACSAYDATFAGAALLVLIANNGHQVNSA
jgi:hypothetical protein